MNLPAIDEAAELATHWRKLYVRTGDEKYLRTAEVLCTLRAAIVDEPEGKSSTTRVTVMQTLTPLKVTESPNARELIETLHILSPEQINRGMLHLTYGDLLELKTFARREQRFEAAAILETEMAKRRRPGDETRPIDESGITAKIKKISEGSCGEESI
jgi:hypothetical protein